MSQCTCTKDAQMTCIVHPTEASLKARIAELEANADTLKEERGRLRDALTLINDRASYFLGVNEEWLIDITKAALLGGGEK